MQDFICDNRDNDINKPATSPLTDLFHFQAKYICLYCNENKDVTKTFSLDKLRCNDVTVNVSKLRYFGLIFADPVVKVS